MIVAGLLFGGARSWRRLGRALCSFSFAMGLAVLLAGPALAEGSADEASATNRQVLDLIKASKLAEADALAQKGLALCEDAGAVKVLAKVGSMKYLATSPMLARYFPTPSHITNRLCMFWTRGLVAVRTS